MIDINYYRKINGTYGIKSRRDINIKNTQDTLFKNIQDHPNSKLVKFNNELESEYVVIISDKNKHKLLIREPSKTIDCGDYIKWKSDIWLCFSIDEDDIYPKGYIQKCNHNLKWINQNDQLITRPCIEDARTLYTTGVKDEKVIEIPNGMVGIQLPHDEETKLLDRGDSFVFNKTKYKVTFYDQTTYPGLVVLICTELPKATHLDDMINEIADRWIETSNGKIDRLPWLDDQQSPIEPDPTEPTQGVSYTITAIDNYGDTDGSEIWCKEWYKYTIHKFVDDVEVDGKFTFEIEILENPDNIELASITNITDNTCTITASNNVVRNGRIKLIVTDVDTEQVAIEKTITIIGY